MNEIPQEIKFNLVFDEDFDGPELRKMKNQKQFGDIKEEIESDEESELEADEGETSANTTSPKVNIQLNE